MALRRGHILVVDDEPSVLVTYRLILEREGYSVSASLTSEEARNLLKKGGIDLLLCDLSLEKQESGFDVIDCGRVLDPQLACVLLTGYATPEAVEWAATNQIPTLFKPIEIQQLLGTIQTLLKDKDEIRQTAS
jgi:DNA-binding NtrC family response regulator